MPQRRVNYMYFTFSIRKSFNLQTTTTNRSQSRYLQKCGSFHEVSDARIICVAVFHQTLRSFFPSITVPATDPLFRPTYLSIIQWEGSRFHVIFHLFLLKHFIILRTA